MLTVLLAALAWAGPQPTPALAATLSGTLTATPKTAFAGSVVRLTGKVRPYRAHLVKLQRKRGSSWATLDYAQTSRTGGFTFRSKVPAGTTQPQTYRVLSPRTRTSRAYVTPARLVRIAPPAVTRVSPGGYDGYDAVLAGDGKHVAYRTVRLNPDRTAQTAVYLWDRATGKRTLLSSGWARAAGVSNGGRFVLLAHNWNGNTSFRAELWDRSTLTATPITQQGLPVQAHALSADGRVIAYTIGQDALQADPLYVRDRVSGAAVQVGPADLNVYSADLSNDGRYVTYMASDPNSNIGVYVTDLTTDSTEQVSLVETPATPSISATGRYVTYVGGSRVYLWDRSTGATKQIGDPFGDRVWFSHASADGATVVFMRQDLFEVAGTVYKVDNIYYWWRPTGRIYPATDGNADSSVPTVSDDGRMITYETNATDLSRADTDTWQDIHLVDVLAQRTQ